MEQRSDSPAARLRAALKAMLAGVRPSAGRRSPRAPRGGNSGGSIPPGTRAHDRLSGGHGDAQC